MSGLVSSVLVKRFTGKNVSEVTYFVSSGTLNLYSNLKPNSIPLAGSKLVGDQLRTSFEPASVMEFGFYKSIHENNFRGAESVCYLKTK